MFLPVSVECVVKGVLLLSVRCVTLPKAATGRRNPGPEADPLRHRPARTCGGAGRERKVGCPSSSPSVSRLATACIQGIGPACLSVAPLPLVSAGVCVCERGVECAAAAPTSQQCDRLPNSSLLT